MAFFAASYFYGRFNWKKFNLNGLFKGFKDDTFKEDANAPILAVDKKIFVNGLSQDYSYTRETKVLEDLYTVKWVDAGKKMKTVFGGTALAFDAPGSPSDGTIIYMNVAQTKTKWIFTDFAVPAKKFLAAAKSKDTKDDINLLKTIFGGDDGIKGSGFKDNLNGFKGDDVMAGLDGDDTMTGGPGNDRIDGQRNDDTVKGNGGNDFLAGAHGNDSLNGGPGRDTMVGGENNDTLKGGPGNDRFVFVNFKSKLEGNDVVVDFQDDKDTLLLDRDLWPGSKSVKQVLAQYATDTGDDVKLTFPGIASSILVKDVDEISDLQNDIALI